MFRAFSGPFPAHFSHAFHRSSRLAKKSQKSSGDFGGNGDGRKPGDQQDSRLKSLESRIKSQRRDEPEPNSARKDAVGFAYALRLSTEFVAAILVGTAIGWMLDRFFGTTPLAMILMLFLGFCAGVLNVMRSAGLVAENRTLRRDGDIDPEK